MDSNVKLDRKIGSVSCTPSTALPGQSILVEVKAPDGTAYNTNRR